MLTTLLRGVDGVFSSSCRFTRLGIADEETCYMDFRIVLIACMHYANLVERDINELALTGARRIH